MLFFLGCIVAALYVLAWMVMRAQKGGSHASITRKKKVELLESLTLSEKTKLYYVDVEGYKALILEGSNGTSSVMLPKEELSPTKWQNRDDPQQ